MPLSSGPARRPNSRAPKDLAESTKLSALDVNLWERGISAPGPTELRRLYRALPVLNRFEHLFPKAPPAVPAAVVAVRREGVVLPPPAPVVAAPAPEVPPAPEPAEEMAKEYDFTEGERGKYADRTEEPAPAPAPVAAPSTLTEPVPFAEAMRLERARLGLKQGPFAQPAGLSGGDISRYERGGSVRQDIYRRLVTAYPALGLAHVATPSGSSRQHRPVAPPPRVSGNRAAALELAQALDDYEGAKASYESAMAAAGAADQRQQAAKARVDELMDQMRATIRTTTAP